MALVLTRRIDEELVFYFGDQEVRLRVTGIRGVGVRMEIQAPQSVRIMRDDYGQPRQPREVRK